MEEQVGELWHRLVTGLAEQRHPQARVELASMERRLGLLFRALGGDAGLQITSAEAALHGARRSWLQRLAGTGDRLALAWRDDNYLRLPAQIDWLPSSELNGELYLWLAALAAIKPDGMTGDWFATAQRRTQQALARYPGLLPRYRRLVDAHIAQRPEPDTLPNDEGTAEQAVRMALRAPGTVARLPPARRPPAPVPLWLHPQPPTTAASPAADDDQPGETSSGGPSRKLQQLRRQAQRVKQPEADRGLLTVRMENIFTWGEFLNVDRGAEDEEDLQRAEDIARDIDQLAVSRGGQRPAATLKFDLDLPAESQDDMPLGPGERLPEWDWKRQQLQPEHCRVQPLLSRNSEPCALPERLGRTARRLRAQFQMLAPARVWHNRQSDGSEIDIDAWLRFASDRAAGHTAVADRLYREMRSGSRDLVCLLMADLSLSTDTWVDDEQRVIDVIRDSLWLFGESLAATGDRFALYGFSSRKRDPVRIHQLKGFDEAYGAQVRGRVAEIKPGYYTRMGAAIRLGARRLIEQPGGRRLLLLLTDGKPNDLDQYEGRYGIEDTRQAVLEARRTGIDPFCVTIDPQGNDYLPYLFGSGGYVVIHRPADLPGKLPLLYAQLTANRQ